MECDKRQLIYLMLPHSRREYESDLQLESAANNGVQWTQCSPFTGPCVPVGTKQLAAMKLQQSCGGDGSVNIRHATDAWR